MTGRLAGADRRADGRQRPARHPPRLHRGGAVERHRGRHRARREQPHPADQPLGRNAACSAARRRSKARQLADVSPELDEFMRGEQREADVLVASAAGSARWRSSACAISDGAVLTFDDITDQLSDQRRAAWSDIARRIAHEIKNPLTPIQLAAERLQRRYRQGDHVRPRDLRAADRHDRPPGRRPAPDGRRILQLRAHAQAGVPRGECPRHRPRRRCSCTKSRIPASPSRSTRRAATFRMVCDRRQLGQALTNVVKNAVEAIEARRNRGEHSLAGDRVELQRPARGRAAGHRRDRHRHRPARGPRAADRALYDDAGARHRPRPRDRQEDRRGTSGRDRLPRPGRAAEPTSASPSTPSGWRRWRPTKPAATATTAAMTTNMTRRSLADGARNAGRRRRSRHPRAGRRRARGRRLCGAHRRRQHGGARRDRGPPAQPGAARRLAAGLAARRAAVARADQAPRPDAAGADDLGPRQSRHRGRRDPRRRGRLHRKAVRGRAPAPPRRPRDRDRPAAARECDACASRSGRTTSSTAARSRSTPSARR